MQTIRSLLVVIEPHLMESFALKRAKEIAKASKAHLHLLIGDKEHDHSALLNVLTNSLITEGYSVTSRQAWHDNLHTTIIKEQQIEGCGLVIKQHVDDSILKKSCSPPKTGNCCATALPRSCWSEPPSPGATAWCWPPST